MSPAQATAEPRTATRSRLLDSASDLFSRQGFGGTGIKAVLTAAEAPYGSLYHFFPGGKQELGAAAVTHGGERYRELIATMYPPGTDVVANTAASFETAAASMESTSYADACPVAAIALEVASSDDVIRAAAADVFESWLAVLQERFAEAGMTDEQAREVAVENLCLMEGAILLARTLRSTAPLRTAGRAAVRSVTAGLLASGIEPASRA